MKKSEDPEVIARNECVGALFAGLTGRDPFLNDSLRGAIEYAIGAEGGSPDSLEAFMRKAMELLARRGGRGSENFAMFHVNLRSRPYEPLWMRGEIVDGLKPMTGCRRSLLVVSGLKEAVAKALPRNRRRMGLPQALAEARAYIDALGVRFAAAGSRVSILYLD